VNLAKIKNLFKLFKFKMEDCSKMLLFRVIQTLGKVLHFGYNKVTSNKGFFHFEPINAF